MTPERKSQIKALIHSDAVAKQLADRGDDLGCATRCTAIAELVRVETVLTERGLYHRVGSLTAESILQKFAAYQGSYRAIVERVLSWMKPAQGGFNFSEPEFIRLLGLLRQDGMPLTDQEHQALDTLSLKPDAISASDVSTAWAEFRPNGKVPN